MFFIEAVPGCQRRYGGVAVRFQFRISARVLHELSEFSGGFLPPIKNQAYKGEHQAYKGEHQAYIR